MIEAIVTGIVGGLLLFMLGWLKSDITKFGDGLDNLNGRLNNRIDTLSDRIDTLNDRTAELLKITARTEGKLEEDLRQHH